MIKILSGIQGHDFEEAAILAFRQAGKDDLPPEIATVFASVIDTDKMSADAEKAINAAIHGRYGRGVRWYGRPWFVPLPQPRYEAQPIPQVTFAVQAYLIAPLEVETRDYTSRITLVGSIAKPMRVVLPIPFLQAILDEDTKQFEIGGRDARSTGWDIPGLTDPLWLPNDLVAGLSAALRRKSISSWLLDFGGSGEAVLPQVTGSLLGLQSHGLTQALPVGKQALRREVVMGNLTRMYGSAVAVEMYQRQAPHLKPTMTNDEATSFILKNEGRGF